MFKKRYARWMYEWETRLTTRDENRIVRPLEWGFEWLAPFLESHGFASTIPSAEDQRDPAKAEAAMVRINELLVRNGEQFFGYTKPTDFRLEDRHPQLYPTNVRPETLAQDAALKQQAQDGTLAPAQFLRFTSPEESPYPENDVVNARWCIRPQRTKTRGGPSRRLSCCRSGTPTGSATTRYARCLTAWGCRRCGSPCRTTTFAGRRSWSGLTTR
jgi:hypothetical protein